MVSQQFIPVTDICEQSFRDKLTEIWKHSLFQTRPSYKITSCKLTFDVPLEDVVDDG